MWLTAAVVLSTLFTVVLCLLPSQFTESADKDRTTPEVCSVQILVLGDIGRSPRMQYHATSILKYGGSVQLIGYLETNPLPELLSHPKASIISLPSTPRFLQTTHRVFFLTFAPLKVVLQVWYLSRALAYHAKPSRWMLVQNPPSIPTLLVAAVVCFLRNTRLLVDWHNFGYSILALKLGQKHPLVRISEVYEVFFARFATANFTVTDAMAKVLRSRFVSNKTILTLHDRPAALYQPLNESERVEFLKRYRPLADRFNSIIEKKARLVVSSTSWTADEDFSLFLDALCQYSIASTTTHPQLPELLVVITGKGPLQSHYTAEIAQLRRQNALEMVTIQTDWLSYEDYAKLLGSADLGVSLHTSSSGVDLPMKVVDMFGAGLPVLGWSQFTAWPELVTDGINGMGFSSSEELSAVLCNLFEPGNKLLAKLKTGALRESRRRWDVEWGEVAGRFFGLR